MSDPPTEAFGDLVAFSESFLERYGPETAEGVGDMGDGYRSSHRALLEVIRDRERPASLLDFGCGLSALREMMDEMGLERIGYAGLDVSAQYVAESRRKYPETSYYQLDVLADGVDALPDFDYVVMSGIFHWRGSRSQAEMDAYLQALVSRMYTKAKVGLAFNVITTQVDWEREDLYHVPVDPLLAYLSQHVSRHVVVRHDYGIYEYTVYVYREPTDPLTRHMPSLLRSQL